MIKIVKARFTNCHNTQLIISLGVPLIKVVGGGGGGGGGEGRRLREGFIKSNKLIYFTADFNLRVVDNNKNEKVTKFLNLTFENG